MLEVEIRYRLTDADALRQRLAEWGAEEPSERIETDHYFNAPHKDFRKTDEALRLRCVGETNRLTYKGPRRDSQTKTRPEIEVPLANGQETARQARDFLIALGFRYVATVSKRRQVYRLQRRGFPVEICFDDVYQVGSFVEVEILTEDENYEQAKATLLQITQELGLHQRELRSYLQMVLEAQTQNNLDHAQSSPDANDSKVTS
ncbi:MAG: class IV adenylate cyclase [Thermogemmata sp.]|jgi:adenylate cyclase class 2|uniref:Class IV adenylate cyclase n=1 Tax=Thermogemmata fonticola TaxID=2755323 RepID=A0A7V8VAZ0_9BACT|nr:class IV adenylate cyclase [Thermogemmata fonticola]MBA2224719.1 class IV adenylate cyclase [Thermogemmata fonticola]MCX8140586.1 class IV adenylate cyclase [Gemmataceae bacterium]